jgi:sec-independent protein translocase protein TatB
MFDIGFSEMIVIAIVALIVIGPERLPGVARTAGALAGRLRRYVSDVKEEVNRELQLEELRKMQQQLAEQANTLEQAASDELKSATAIGDPIPSPVNEDPSSSPVQQQ